MSLAVIILTYNEETHIIRCINSLGSVADSIYIVDSYSTDQTVMLAESMGAKVLQHPWKNYADQFQWAIDQCGFGTDWLMRMDADEYLEPELQKELLENLSTLREDVIGIYLKRKVLFEGRWIRHGGFYPQTLLRIWRVGQGRIEQRWMDEHIVLPEGAGTITMKEHIVDANLKGITFWVNKHNGYATREMADILINKYFPAQTDHALQQMRTDPQARWKRIVKEEVYNKLPIGLRTGLYFFYRYCLLFGFLDGSKGFLYHFLQGFWYRLLVDIKVMEVEGKAKGNVIKIREILKKEHGIEL